MPRCPAEYFVSGATNGFTIGCGEAMGHRHGVVVAPAAGCVAGDAGETSTSTNANRIARPLSRGGLAVASEGDTRTGCADRAHRKGMCRDLVWTPPATALWRTGLIALRCYTFGSTSQRGVTTRAHSVNNETSVRERGYRIHSVPIHSRELGGCMPGTRIGRRPVVITN